MHSAANMMQCVYRQNNKDQLECSFVSEAKVSIPKCEPHMVLVQVKACGFSHLSSKALTELFKKSPRRQHPAGWEVAGVITAVGDGVTTVSHGTRVAGVLPLDSSATGCAEFCLFSEYDVVPLPAEVEFRQAAAVIGDGLKAYTALYSLARLEAGDTVLVIGAGLSWGCLVTQLAHHWGAKVLATSGSAEEKVYLEKLQPPVDHIVELGSKNNILCSSVMEETGGLGVDVIVDCGVRLYTNDEDVNLEEAYTYPVPSKHELISCLGVGGRWITTHPELQLDPPNSQLLYLRGASISFLFEHTWTLSATQYGRYHHVQRDMMEKLKTGVLRPHITREVTLAEAAETLRTLPQHRFGKVIMATT